MAKEFLPIQRRQQLLMPPAMMDWLPARHPALLLIDVVENKLDTSAFHEPRHRGGAGAAGYDPDMMVTVLIWAYANGISSSRRIEELCRTDIPYMVICGGNHPDHTTISRFRKESPRAMAELFAEVLGLCAKLGMIRLGTVALDGTKVAASASKSASRTLERLEELAAQAVAAHAATDAAEDEEHGPGRRRDEVPEELTPQARTGRAGREERLDRALAELRAERKARQDAARQEEAAKAARFRDRKAAGEPTGPAPAGSEAELAQERADELQAEQQARIDDWEARDAADRAAGGPGLSRRTRPRSPAADYVRVRQAQAKADKARQREAARDAAREKKQKDRPPRRNLTDPDSRLMPVTGGGFIQGYNAQNATSSDGIIFATRLTTDTSDVAWLEPMLARMQAAAARIDALRPPGTTGPGGIGLVLADAGYKSEHNMTCPGPDRLIATGKHHHLEKQARHPDLPPDPGGPATMAMAQRLKTEDGIAAYRQRGHIAETPHGNIKHNKGFRQFSLRGLEKATAEWELITSVHNLFKAISSGHLTTEALQGI